MAMWPSDPAGDKFKRSPATKKHAARVSALDSLLGGLGLSSMAEEKLRWTLGGAKHTYVCNLQTGDYCDFTTNDSTGKPVVVCFSKGHAI